MVRYTIDDLRNAIATSFSWRQVAIALSLNPSGGGSYVRLKRLVKEQNISTSHFTGKLWNKGQQCPQKKSQRKFQNEELFVANSDVVRSVIRRRILKDNLLPYRCAICDMPPEWQGKKLSLVLDHINGVPNDHMLENLRFVCPNCNAQLPTFCSKSLVAKVGVEPTNRSF